MMRSPEQIVAEAARIDTFLKDDVVSGVLSRMERRYYEEFLSADTSEKRAVAQGKAKVLRDFEHEMKVILDDGEVEVLKAAREAKHSNAVKRQEN